ncbi:MAG: dihydroorotate dehydrogenase [Stygiobacter sp. RIFOXYC12_FULL_38_8]|nr:MAG: dihydroorotate dehydrogenase [Stygiobacter sp. GWC2_38_9]OGU79765.1 MAG: dihydroorotate dehydrogenase [Stygiobacter sp. RIFOXYA12_FULL_38_9]OGV06074.1 MAG: dihydroorotate dehydrogenase [Stygiobacter sp. RIFOXYB2_FULL_37_11]OGV10199.1 MAG: dihydroorotate dehydrogenase [Stygiobacter sp. RIFOXYA2_FULL_38_8]OGV16862.1 MAG: dihydroorotate dehydrogenase [Stygiobacter sp. RIFOXYC2_FULL_38_25]OGV28507.1 MAG: dihydroorotate dehydrogenase [Stygiobacter sp. RIFOXYC12_FULL_38_8]OGV82787.1 MAG: di
MLIEKSILEAKRQLGERIFQIKLFSPRIAKLAKPGQFCNIKVSESDFPLLRRPFSISNVEGDSIYFLFDIHGEGTKILSEKSLGDELDILGPLGNGFNYDGDYSTAIIVAGGLGSAPFPFLTSKLDKKKVVSFVGARNSSLVLTEDLLNVQAATDDGSLGFKGTVVELLTDYVEKNNLTSFRIFSCGPNPMLKALQQICIERNYDCQISIECAMACGFGICQGCPVETTNGEGYKLVCKDGPVFEAKEVKL